VVNLHERPRLTLAAHFDTLGLMLSGIRRDGKLSFSLVGSPSLNDIEGGHVRIYSLNGKVFTGSVYLDNPAKHANAELSNLIRSHLNMHIVLDETVENEADVRQLGIAPGDFVALETNYRETPSGFIKSRFLDNKIACLVLFETAKYFKNKGLQPPVSLFFSNYEEVGHGAAGGYDENTEELLVLDMGVVGNGLEGSELFCSICAKDSSGPYDFSMRKKLTELAQKNNIPYKTDVYPYYSSDGSAAWRAGEQFRVALIGAGVAASHGSERAHIRGIKASIDLCIAYIEDFMERK
jgi:putative aminopeptidase FrvX